MQNCFLFWPLVAEEKMLTTSYIGTSKRFITMGPDLATYCRASQE